MVPMSLQHTSKLINSIRQLTLLLFTTFDCLWEQNRGTNGLLSCLTYRHAKKKKSTFIVHNKSEWQDTWCKATERPHDSELRLWCKQSRRMLLSRWPVLLAGSRGPAGTTTWPVDATDRTFITAHILSFSFPYFCICVIQTSGCDCMTAGNRVHFEHLE